MSTETQVVAVEDISADKAPAIFGHNKLSAYVEAARAASNEVPDLTTRKGRERIASLAAQVSRSKTAVEKPGREYLKRIKELPKAIETELREFVTAMDTLRDEVRQPLTLWEEAEAARVAKHESAIEAMKLWSHPASDTTASELQDTIAALEQIDIGADWEEYEAEAHRVKAASLTTLREALAKREQYEAEQAELERLRAEAAAREQREREERIAREAEERARREAEQRAQAERDAAAKREADALAAAEQARLNAELAEQRRIAAEKQAEIDRQAAAERERLAAEQAERDAQARAEAAAAAERQRQADEQARIQAEAEAREADKEHRRAINNEALAAFIAAGMPEDCARKAIELIAKRQIPHILITY